jgi:thiamine-phosphate pyrophosphorylase
MAISADLEIALGAPAKGATLIQLRAPGLAAAELERRTRRLVSEAGVPVLVSSRIDVALACGAAGVNLPEADLPVAEARRLLGPERLLGRSVHSLDTALLAEQAGADYVIFGPVFATPGHGDDPGAGLAALADVARGLRIPVLAIGGVDAERGRRCLEAGAAGYAAIRLFLQT